MSQDLNDGYDTYDSVVVCAENEEEARRIHPYRYVTHYRDGKWYRTHSGSSTDEYETENEYGVSWVKSSEIDKIKVEYLGEARESIEKGVIVSSFNAG